MSLQASFFLFVSNYSIYLVLQNISSQKYVCVFEDHGDGK